jgi:hypothetical protein
MRSTGVTIICVFAAIWWSLGLASAGYGSLPWLAVGAAISLGLVAAAVRSDRLAPRPQHAGGRRGWSTVGIASFAEGVAILVTVNALNWLGLPGYAACGIAIIVGLHFVPLARALPYAAVYNYTAAALVSLGLAGCFVPQTTRDLFVGVGAACILWATCMPIISIRRTLRIA